MRVDTTRRKTVGRRIQRARRRAGYRSAKAFADALPVSENSVAKAESGADTVGDTVFVAIETALGWPEDCITRYIETGDESLLPSATEAEPVDPSRYPDWLNVDDEKERKVWDLDLSVEDRWFFIQAHRLRNPPPPPSSEPGSNTRSA